jgi:septum formation protein
MLNKRFQNKKLVLASQSPRRQYLLKELGLEFEIMPTHVDETFAEGMNPVDIAIRLAELKAGSFDASRLQEDTIVIAADTLVCVGDEILGKPGNSEEAIGMLEKLSGTRHTVVTAVCLRSKRKQKTFHVVSYVYFRELSREEIEYYIENFRPFDKAGSYGIQEWIGYIGISRIEGSYFNIMGLPVKELYEELLQF